MGPTLCYRGIDNASYYWLTPDNPRYYENFTGTGNSLKLAHPACCRWSWIRCGCGSRRITSMASASISPPRSAGQPAFDRNAPFFGAVRQDPVLCNVKLIAEPWDIGDGGYQVGAFPNGWSEWNDAYRQTLRRFWRGDDNVAGDLAHSMTGSSVQFQHDGRSPHTSINHITVHDGFTLEDLVSYEQKHNLANGEDNRDGSDDNLSANCGVEGPTDDPAILAMRRRRKRNQLACLFLAQGIPLLLAGDEVSNSQNGNNNTYCQDNQVGWVDWSKAGSEDDYTALIGELTRLRRDFPGSAPHRWLEGKKADGSYDVKWLTPHATEMTEADWNLPHARFIAYVLAAPAEGGKPLFVVLNRTDTAVEITFPEWLGVTGWRCVLDTSDGHEPFAEAAARRQLGRARAMCAGLRGQVVNAQPRFGPIHSDRGVTFRLWAPSAREVNLLLGNPVTANLAMTRHGEWFELNVAGAATGTHYRFRVDNEIEIPDPASQFQPEDVSGPSEVIDHTSYPWQAKNWKGLPWEQAVLLEAHVGTLRPPAPFAP